LPFQRQLPTLNVLPTPSRHLYLQLVEKQTRDRDELVLAFGKAVSWIVLNDRDDTPTTVWRFGGGSDDQRLHDEYIEAKGDRPYRRRRYERSNRGSQKAES
jgi:hypothetical protein